MVGSWSGSDGAVGGVDDDDNCDGGGGVVGGWIDSREAVDEVDQNYLWIPPMKK